MRKLRLHELNRLTLDEFKKSKKNNIIVILDNIRSLNNIGSIFRTSDALAIEALYLCGITATPPNNEIHKTALGAEESVEWKYFEKTIDAVNELRSLGYKIYSIEQAENSISLIDYNTDPNQKQAFIFGNEVKGVDQEVINLSDGVIEIPQFGTKHSFNVSVTAGIVLWDVTRKNLQKK